MRRFFPSRGIHKSISIKMDLIEYEKKTTEKYIFRSQLERRRRLVWRVSCQVAYVEPASEWDGIRYISSYLFPYTVLAVVYSEAPTFSSPASLHRLQQDKSKSFSFRVIRQAGRRRLSRLSCHKQASQPVSRPRQLNRSSFFDQWVVKASNKLKLVIYTI